MGRPLIEAYHQGEYDGSSLFSISSQAALFSPTVQQQFLEAFPNAVLTDAIGSSEGGYNGIQMITKDGVYTGGPRVNTGPDVIVIDDEGKPVPPGSEVIGKIGRSGPIPLGYYTDPEKTAALFVEVDGTRYVVPCDFARVEADGTVTMLGRANTCVNTGGEKVFPEEVEGALKSHPDVFDALVIGEPDERFGQRVAAVIAPRPGATLDPAALDAHVRGLIAGYKVPRTLWIADEVGRLPSGKPDYRWAHRHAAEHQPAAGAQTVVEG
jgi:acyl-CoA synthetase (AMP-forming)/AMP-acid ligase II